MGLEAPVGGAVHTGRAEGCEAELVLAGGDILSDLLEIVKGLDVINRVACLLKQGLVGDEAVGLDNVCDAEDLIAVLQ